MSETIDLIMKCIFLIMMVSELLYFGYALAISECKSFDFHGIWSNRQLKIFAARFFDNRHAHQFITIVKTFKYSFISLILLMVVQGVLGGFT